MSMKLHAFRTALAVAAIQAAYMPAVVHASGDGSTSTLIDQPTATSPGATPETIAAYSFIAQRTLHPHSNMIDGQHLGGPGDLGAAPGSPDDVFDMQLYRIPSATMPGLNAYPRLVGARYDANVGTGAHAVYTLSAPMIAQIDVKLEGIYNTYHSLIAVTATPRNPWDPTQGRLPALGQGSLAELRLAKRSPPGPNQPDTPVNRFWNDIDTIGGGFANLKDANGKPIPVLFRPFAELNTNKYYYKGQNAKDFVNLWNDVVGYYQHNLNLHNLIYCWEAWTWGSSASEANVDAWFPVGQVDVVGGAFYFTQQDKTDGYFNLVFGQAGSQTQQNLNDQAIFNDLMGLAVTNNKPFGAMQWAVDSTDGTVGDDRDTLTFMTSLDVLHANPQAVAQHMAFNYYWTTAEEANKQTNPSALVDDPRVATVSSLDGVQAKQGAIQESAAGSQVGGGQPFSTLQTGFSAANQQYRTILSFAAGMLPSTAAIDPTNGLTLLMSPVTPGAPSPFSVPGQRHCLDAAYLNGAPTYFGNSAALATEDFSAAGATCVASTNDWSTNSTTGRAPANFSAASLSSAYLNPRAPTQFRVYFTQPQAGSLVAWNGTPVTGLNTGDDPAPQLIFSYTLP
jgi:hypothetical protein